MAVGVVDGEVVEVAGVVDSVVVVAGSREVSAARPGFRSRMIMLSLMRNCHENMHDVDVGQVHEGVAVVVAVVEGFELLDLGSR
jgi:hypothetical protein